jgi:preprotein translocase subunit YajC
MALLLPVALLGLFYVFLILPKQRELKRHNALVASLEVGDEVMTGSGFYGTLTEVDGDTVLVRLAPGLEVKLARRAVAAKVPDPAALDAAGTDAIEAAEEEGVGDEGVDDEESDR